jgi:uncharacterized protein YodC (DUF2158 family)
VPIFEDLSERQHGADNPRAPLGNLLLLQCNLIRSILGILAMPLFKSGDLVMLKSGGPVMTVDTVNTDIFDDDKMTGVLCAWFVGQKLERVRFDHRAIELAPVQAIPANKEAGLAAETIGDYKAVLDNMVDAMNAPADAPATEVPDDASRVPAKRRRARSLSESRSGEGTAVVQ